MAIRDRNERISNFFGSQRAGSGNLFGGPPPPPAAPAPAPPPQSDSQGKYDIAGILAEARGDGGGGSSGPSNIGESLVGGLGTVLGGAAKKLDWVANLGMLGAEELSEFIAGEEFESQLNADGTLNEFGKQGNWEKLNDPEYGFGKLVPEMFGDSDNSTWQKWANRTAGFVGDVALDPVTYVGGAVLKSPLAIGKAGRMSVSQTATRMGLPKEVGESISKYGPAYLDDVTRAKLGYKKQGVYWGVGDASFRIPLTKNIGKASERTFSGIRVNTAGRLTGKVGKGRGKAQFAQVRRILATGKAEDGISVANAGRFMNAIDDIDMAAGTAGEKYSRQAQASFSSVDEKTRSEITKEIQAAPTVQDASRTADQAPRTVIADKSKLSPAARAWVNLRDEMYEAAEDVGIDIGNLGGNYMPLRMNEDGWDFIRRFPQAAEYREDLTAPTAAAMRRKLKANTSHQFGEVTVKIGDDDSIAGIEAAFQKAFAGTADTVPKFFEDNAVVLMERYIGEMSRNMGVANMFRQAIEDGTVKELADVATDEMITTGANTLKNKAFSKQLKDIAKNRANELAEHEQKAFAMAKQIGKELKVGLRKEIKDLGDAHASLRPQLKAIDDALKVDDIAAIRQQFTAMRVQAQTAANKTVKEIEELETSIAAFDLNGGPGAYSASETAYEDAQVALNRMHELLVERQTAYLLADRLDEHFGVVFRQHDEIQERLDSPQQLSEYAETLMDDGFIVHFPEETYFEHADSPAMRVLVDKKATAEERLAAVDMVEEEAAVIAARGQAAEAAGHLDDAAVAERNTTAAKRLQAQALEDEIVNAPKFVPDEEAAALVERLKRTRKNLRAKIARREEKLEPLQGQKHSDWSGTKRASVDNGDLGAVAQVKMAREKIAALNAEDAASLPEGQRWQMLADAEAAILDAEWWMSGYAHRVLNNADSVEPRVLTAVEKRAVKRLEKKKTKLEEDYWKLLQEKPAGVNPALGYLPEVPQRRLGPKVKTATQREVEEWENAFKKLKQDRTDVDKQLRDLNTEVDGPGDAMKELYDTATSIQNEINGFKKEIGEVRKQIAGLMTDPELQVKFQQLDELWKEVDKGSAAVARMRTGAYEARNTPPPVGQSGIQASRIQGLNAAIRLESYNRIQTKITEYGFPTFERVKTANGVTRQPGSLSTIPELENRMGMNRTILAAIEDSEWMGTRPQVWTSTDVVSDAEISAVRKYLAVLRKPMDEAETAWRQAKKKREKDFPNFTKQGSDEVEAGGLRTELQILQGIEDSDQALTKVQKNRLDELKAAMSPAERKVFDQRKAPTFSGRERGMSLNTLAEDGQRAVDHTQMSPGALAQQNVDELQKVYTDARRAYRDALRAYGIDAKRLNGDGLRTGTNMRWDKNYQKRLDEGFERGTWVDALQYQEPQAVRNHAREVWDNNWEEARKAHPKDTSTPNGVPKKDFDQLTPHQAARIAGGRVEIKRATTIARGNDRIAKIKKPGKLEEAASDEQVAEYKAAMELYRSQMNDRVSSIVRLMSKRERRQLHNAAMEDWRIHNAVSLNEHAIVTRQLADDAAELEILTGARQSLLDDPVRANAALAKGYQGAQREVIRDVKAEYKRTESLYNTLKSQGEKLEAEELNAVERHEELGRALDRMLAGKEDEFERLAAIEARIGVQETEAVHNAMAARKVLDDTKQSKEALQVWLGDRTKKLNALVNRAEKLRSGGRKDSVTQKTLEKQIRDYRAIMNEIGVNPAQSPELMAVARLMDDHLTETVRLQSRREALKDIGDLAKEANRGELVLDVERQLLDGWKVLDNSLFPNNRDMAIDSKLDEMLTSWKGAMEEDLGMKWFDEATQVFKSYATMTPGFHLRNFMGATFMNFSDGVTVRDTREGMMHWRRYVKDADYFDNLPPDQQYVKDAFGAVMVVGAGGSFDAGEIGSGLARGMKGLKNNKATRMSRQLGEDLVEGPVRLAAALNTTRRLAADGVAGPHMSQAAARVKRLHFNYADISALDKKMKRVVPFYMFLSRNLPLQLEQMWRKPKAYAVYNHFMNNFDQSEEDSLMPKYLKDAGAISMGMSWFGDESKDFVFAPDLQHNNLMQDIMAFSGEGEDGIPLVDGFLASGNPILSKPVEIAFNHSGFRGGDQFFDKQRDEYGNWVDKSGQQKALERIMYGLEGFLTPTGTGQGLAGIDIGGGDYGKERAKDKQLQKALNFIGLPFKGVGETEKEYERRRREGE